MTMSEEELKEEIRKALHALKDGDLQQAAREFFKLLGYESERTLSLGGALENFMEKFPSPSERTRTNSERSEHERTESEKTLRKFTEFIHIVFQVTDEEINPSAQTNLPINEKFDHGRIKSFLFLAVRLKPQKYARGKYAQMAREVNKRLGIPTVVLFMNGDKATIAFMDRRAHKIRADRDVLGKVFLIRDVGCADPHRAHLDILAELSLGECLNRMEKEKNFDSLLAVWLKTLNTEELNKKFYEKLHAWYQRAVEIAKFPSLPNKTVTPQDQVIRLITRILFVWFIKEKRLVSDKLFSEAQVGKLLKDFRPDGDDYYCAILQNLFFATLNTEIKRRKFSEEDNSTHRNFNLYRYKSMLADKKALLELMKETPFINGGLFDCLDSEESESVGGYRLDCFTDNAKHRKELSVPNSLFFDEEHGLFPLLDGYKFTVEENTPIEQEVALDPELLGKVFENLLAAYNPETSATAQQQTGSFYTPREVVDYMVDEALLAYLGEKVAPDDGDAKWWGERLRYLLDYADAFDDAEELFSYKEKRAISGAVADIRVIDPAVGSGAFPTGVLHKLSLVLRRIDLNNKIWEELQKVRARERLSAAVDTDNPDDREEELTEISRTFQTYRKSDFGRKLYLIQNSIFGVDIQSIACQIAKLRFFISLAIEQKTTKNENDNYGVKPLPNLETRFVSADTLLGLEKPKQMGIGETEDVQKLERQLGENRERHFNASNRQKKLDCIKKDKELRRKLKKKLEKTGLPPEQAKKIANWNPYDQNAVADWFSSEYMFGISDGFDVVIGNPPYIQLQRHGGRLGDLYENAGYESFASTGDIYQLFMEKGCSLLTPKSGVLSYITSNSWLKAEYGKKLRRYFSNKHTPLCLLEMGADIFENAIVDTNILIVRNGKSDEHGKAVDMDRLSDKSFPPDEKLWGNFRMRGEMPWIVLSDVEQSIMDKVERIGTPLKDWEISIYRGILTGFNDAFIIDTETKEALIAQDPKSAEIIKPVLRGRDIQRYQAKWAELWIITTFPSLQLNIDNYPAIESHLLSFGKDRLEQSGKQLANGKKSRKKTQHSWFEIQDAIAYHEEFSREKLFWMDMSDRGRFALSGTTMYCNNKGFVMTGSSVKYLCAILNSTLITWLIRNTARTTGMGLTQWEKFSVERLPIPKITTIKRRPFIRLVDKILSAKAADPSADTSELETEIDRLVYDLYDISEKEIAIIEGQK